MRRLRRAEGAPIRPLLSDASLQLGSRLALVGWLLATVVLSVTNHPSLPHPGGSDKLAHFLAYALHGLLSCFSFPPGRALVLALTAVAGLGVALEGAQALLPARDASLGDIAANLAGIACGAAIGRGLRSLLRGRVG